MYHILTKLDEHGSDSRWLGIDDLTKFNEIASFLRDGLRVANPLRVSVLVTDNSDGAVWKGSTMLRSDMEVYQYVQNIRSNIIDHIYMSRRVESAFNEAV